MWLCIGAEVACISLYLMATFEPVIDNFAFQVWTAFWCIPLTLKMIVNVFQWT
jgi:hypothetical protein